MASTYGSSDSLFTPGRRARVLQLLRQFTDDHLEMTRHLARALGVRPTDAVAVAEILWAEATGEPLSPARLAKRVGLTSGSTAGQLNRLEAGGLVVRSREAGDRRMVTLRLTPDAVAQTSAVLATTGERVDRVLDGYDDATLQTVEHLLAAIVAATTAGNARLRAADLATVSGERDV